MVIENGMLWYAGFFGFLMGLFVKTVFDIFTKPKVNAIAQTIEEQNKSQIEVTDGSELYDELEPEEEESPSVEKNESTDDVEVETYESDSKDGKESETQDSDEISEDIEEEQIDNPSAQDLIDECSEPKEEEPKKENFFSRLFKKK